MTESIAISLPSALWLAKLTPSSDPDHLLADVDGVPTSWLDTPLATAHGFGGLLSLADVGHRIEPNLFPTGSMPIPGDRIIIARTGRRVEVFGAVEVVGLSAQPGGGLRIGHRPLIRFDSPVDLRSLRSTNRLLDQRWSHLFGHRGRDRRLLPLVDHDVALCFAAFGFSLEQLFAEQPTGTTAPAPPWRLDEQVDVIDIGSELISKRIADGVSVFHALRAGFDADPGLVSVDISRDLLLSLRASDHTSYLLARSVVADEPVPSWVGEPGAFGATASVDHRSMPTLVAVEADDHWSLIELAPIDPEASLGQ